MARSDETQCRLDGVHLIVEMHDQRRVAFRQRSTDVHLGSGVLSEVENAIVTENTGQIFDVPQGGSGEMAIWNDELGMTALSKETKPTCVFDQRRNAVHSAQTNRNGRDMLLAVVRQRPMRHKSE